MKCVCSINGLATDSIVCKNKICWSIDNIASFSSWSAMATHWGRYLPGRIASIFRQAYFQSFGERRYS